MTGPLEYLLLRCEQIARNGQTLALEVNELRDEVAALRRRVEYLEEQTRERKRLLRLWTEKTYKARAGRDMWRARALRVEGTKRRMKST